MLSITGSDITPTPPLVDRQTGVKTLPCPKLRLRVVKMKVTFQVTILCDTYGKVSRSVRCPYNTSISVWSIAESGE